MGEPYKIKIFVIDDEPLVLEDVVHELNSSGFFEVTGAFTDLPSAFHAIGTLGPPDFVLCDIHMSGQQGLNATKMFEGVCKFVVLMTAHEESAADAFRTYPKGCVFKSITIADLMPFVKEYYEWRKLGQESNGVTGDRIYLPGKERGLLLAIPVADITYAETDSDYVKIFAPTLIAHPYMTMKTLVVMLARWKSFVRISRKHLVSIDKIDHINGQVVYVPNDGQNEKNTDFVALPVTPFGKDDFDRFIAAYKKPGRDEGEQTE